MYFIKYLFKINFIFFKYLGSPESFSMKSGVDIKDSPIELNLQNLNVDGKLTRKEIDEVKKIKEYSKEKLDLLFDTQNRFKEFINLEYKYANENYLSSKGKTIRDLQKELNKELGLNLVLDNIFGKQTFLAIIKFQKENNLIVDGLIGKETFKKLFRQKEQKEDKSGEEKQKDNRGLYKGETMLALEREFGLDNLDYKKHIILKAIQAVKEGDRLGARNCTDWVSKVWGKDVNTGGYVFRGKIKKGNEGTGLIPLKYAPKNTISTIEPGDHILVDKPPYNTGITHSIMALEKPNDGLVKVASFPGFGNPKIELRDLYGNGRGKRDAYVARINRLT